MRRILVLYSLCVVPLASCNLFDAGTGTTEPEPQSDPAAERTAEAAAAVESCKAGDDTGCAKLYAYPEYMNQVTEDLKIEQKRPAAMILLSRACKGGNRHACTSFEQHETLAAYQAKQAREKAEYDANLRLFTAEEIGKVELGWTVEQVEDVLGNACTVTSRRKDAAGAEHANHACMNSDVTGASIDFVDGKVSQVRMLGNPTTGG